jgi:hypothetical protein
MEEGRGSDGEKIDVKTGNKAKGNSNRTPSQIEAFERARDKKREIAKIKKDNTDAIRIEKEIDLQAKKLQTIEIQKRINMYKSEDEEAEEEEVVIVPKKKALAKAPLPIPVAKTKKKKIIYQEEESEESEEEIIIVRPKKSKAKTSSYIVAGGRNPLPKKKIIYQEEESEEEEEPLPKKNLPQHIQKNAQEQMKFDLHTERINSALRSLGYIG